MNSFSSIAALVSSVLLLTACGLKGPLYLPPKEPAAKEAPPADVKPDAAKPEKPAKAPMSSGDGQAPTPSAK
ncbi:MAG: lipoprotein [Methylococcaceae bacterium]|nr:lipoprotein [Methylococcaceae bacterium]